MIALVSNNSPMDIAWAAFDAAAIRFHRLYDRGATLPTGALESAARMAAAQDVARLWNEWRELFLAEGDEPRPAA